MRLDRALTLRLFRPLKRLIPGPPSIPILMYHSISNDEETVHPYYRVNTSPKIFADHMRFLSEEGYKTISLHEVHETTSQVINHAKTDKCVVLTFDDGFQDFYTEAFPVLRLHGFFATVFLSTAYVGSRCFKRKTCLSWDEVRELHREGIIFGSHTHTHSQLRDQPSASIIEELQRSKKIIEDSVGSPITAFSYPYRFPEEDVVFKRTLRRQLLDQGYSHGVTTIIGRVSQQDDCLFMKRQPANSSDDISLLRAKLEGGYDWLHSPQLFSKKIRAQFQRTR